DAAVACNDGRLGTVSVLEDIANPVQVARLVMDEDFDALAGKGALDYARSRGITPTTVTGSEKPWAADTVGAVAQDSNGVIAVASSTGGIRDCLTGRVGDTPHWGGGLWTDTGVGIAATGIGEAISRRLLCFRVARRMVAGLSVQEALEWGITLYPSDTIIGLIALSDTEGTGVSNSSMPWALRQD
ncbi:MAG: isoaspartyl peptidase/L-asparaginase, partial [Candidatus Thermoplasmatota archaeon]|nr:isoaspartyl peptidase/L-asparaginase [Candidatus Thermoplasmatota archaeon]